MGSFHGSRIKNCIIKTALASGIMGSFVYLTRVTMENFFSLNTFFAVLATTGVSLLVAAVVYFISLKAVKSSEFEEVIQSIFKYGKK